MPDKITANETEHEETETGAEKSMQALYYEWIAKGESHENFGRFSGISDADKEKYFEVYLSHCREKIPFGKYKHFKTGPNGEVHTYHVYGAGQHREKKKVMVAYYPEYGDKTGQLMFRPAHMFMEEIDRDGYNGSRFKKI